MARIACILVADFPLAAAVRSRPELHGQSVALSSSHEGHAELTAVSARARAAGVRIGMTLAQARALSSDLIVETPSAASECSARDAILDAAESFSPMVEDGGPGCAYLDLAGLAAIHGTENAMAAELARRVARIGIETAIGIASSKETAYLAAKCGGQRVIASEKEREFLDWLPLDVLDLDGGGSSNRDGLELTLARWGIRRLGELARIDARALGSRLGARGVELARLARGEGRSPFVPRPHSELFIETIELDYGIEMLEPLCFVMRPMVERLAVRLALRGLSAGDVTLSLGTRRGRQQRSADCGRSADHRGPLAARADRIEPRSVAAARRDRGDSNRGRAARDASRAGRHVPAALPRARSVADHDRAARRPMRPRSRRRAQAGQFLAPRRDRNRRVRIRRRPLRLLPPQPALTTSLAS